MVASWTVPAAGGSYSIFVTRKAPRPAATSQTIKEPVAEPERSSRTTAAGLETDPHKLRQRMKQIHFGKSTKGYEAYRSLVPTCERDASVHPVTPRHDQLCSKRSWDAQVRQWRRQLHEWDPPCDSGSEKACSEGTAATSGGQRTYSSWASECSDAPDYQDLSGFSLD
eukprot:TRINITY_DN9907_c0_g1_i1.p1 TRINITY_DN9907_c0_g1~~TRINITY_DN9907_c0_g1_i1.p1  ORF type:complete len:168 (-),score=20.96 TRINITY_DN9907_c0_g1_i1:346-849(-)